MSSPRWHADPRRNEAPPQGTTTIGVVVPTTGRWDWIAELLDSVESSSVPVVVTVIANQSGRTAPASIRQRLAVEVVNSTGGASAGRNSGLRLLGDSVDLISLPNDHSRFQTDTLARLREAFAQFGSPPGLAGTLMEPLGARFALPPNGTCLNRFTVWRAIEPAMFITPEIGQLRFRENIGHGSYSPWQAGEGTDLLLRAMSAGHRVVAAPEVIMRGRGEHRDLSPEEQRVKLRSYARGTGYVMRLNHAPPIDSAVHILSPLWRLAVPPPNRLRPSLAVTANSMVGRVEGRLGRCLPTGILRLGSDSLRK